MPDRMPDRKKDASLSRTELLLGREAMEKLASARVAVFGIGGVGGHAAEALVRSGIGQIDLIDGDVVTESNLNRQIFAARSTLGMKKVDAARARLSDIRPECVIRTFPTFFLPEKTADFDFSVYRYVVDAIDTVAGKIGLVLACRAAGTPIICSMGAGNKLDASAFRTADLYETKVCPLARVMRAELKKRGVEHLKVVYSEEPPIAPRGKPEESAGKTAPGSTAFVPPAAGLILAGEVIRDIAGV